VICGCWRVQVFIDDMGWRRTHSRAARLRPFILLIRRFAGRRAAEQATVILANLESVTEDLEHGAVVVLADEWVRVRRLPIGS
jgi:hypothetical protein